MKSDEKSEIEDEGKATIDNKDTTYVGCIMFVMVFFALWAGVATGIAYMALRN